ncbi:MAG: hypothetical protein JO250_20645 [Armatimonadetes bacterium]|nr:hypothetical protein [Armatimonadota bacterium]
MAGTTVNPYRFGGQAGYRRDGANREYVRARHLDAQKGRWASRDPIAHRLGQTRLVQQVAAASLRHEANAYQYVLNKPVGLSDPAGLSARSCALACLTNVDSIANMLYERIAQIANGLCSGTNVATAALRCWKTQSCFDRIGWSCDRDVVGEGDSPQYTRSCCLRCGNCVMYYWQGPLENVVGKWQARAEKICKLEGKLNLYLPFPYPPALSITDPCDPQPGPVWPFPSHPDPRPEPVWPYV